MNKRFVLRSAKMQAVDKATIEELGICQEVLMEKAALAVVSHTKKYLPKRILCVCGNGNNGGDAIAVARILVMQGIFADVFLCGEPDLFKESVKKQLDIFIKAGGKTRTDMDFSEYDMIIDGIFGVGLSREITGFYKNIIEAVNNAGALGAKIIAVDIPSGIHTDTGQIMGVAVKADETISFAYYKPGHLLYPGAGYCGNVYVEDIGISCETVMHGINMQQFIADTGLNCYDSDIFTVNKEDDILLPSRMSDGHKGTFGRVLVIAGSSKMYGACYLSALSALKTGAGLVEVYTHEVNRMAIQTMLPEAIFCSYDDDLTERIKAADCVVIGPGLSTDDTAVSLVKTVLLNCDKPIVADADALNCIALNGELADLLERRTQSNVILTPHLGELSRLTGINVSEIKTDYMKAVAELALKYNCVVVGKDAGTIVSDGDVFYINQTGNSGMATAGSGDVLSGIIGALCIKEEHIFEAAWKGVFLHGKAGDAAACKSNEYSLIAGDIANALAEVIKK